jgi:hypothetical protein
MRLQYAFVQKLNENENKKENIILAGLLLLY